LVLHQRLQRRDDDGEQAAPVMANQRRQLVAERFAPARGQYGEQLAALETLLDQRSLQAAAVRRRRRRAERRQAEEAPQQSIEIVVTAVGATRVAARPA